MNQDLLKNIIASVNKHFVDRKQSERLYIEGEDLDLSNLVKWAELRVTGPDITEISRNQFKIELEVDILCSSIVVNDIYVTERLAGIFIAAFVPINLINESSQFLGCLNTVGPVRTVRWGNVQYETSPTERNNISLECPYYGEL